MLQGGIQGGVDVEISQRKGVEIVIRGPGRLVVVCCWKRGIGESRVDDEVRLLVPPEPP
jgi:hypothetical protein